MLNANRFSADMSVFDNKESAWDFTLKPFHDHAYITIRFAKNVPGNIKNSEYDQEIPQSQTEDKPVAPREEPLNHHKTPGRQIK